MASVKKIPYFNLPEKVMKLCLSLDSEKLSRKRKSAVIKILAKTIKKSRVPELVLARRKYRYFKVSLGQILFSTTSFGAAKPIKKPLFGILSNQSGKFIKIGRRK